MDHIFKNSITTEHSKINAKNNFFLNEWNKVRYMWKQDFKFYSPIEKFFVVVCFGQILKSIGNLLDIEYPSINSFLPSVLWKSKKKPAFERVLFFDVDEKSQNIIPNSKALSLLK